MSTVRIARRYSGMSGQRCDFAYYLLRVEKRQKTVGKVNEHLREKYL